MTRGCCSGQYESRPTITLMGEETETQKCPTQAAAAGAPASPARLPSPPRATPPQPGSSCGLGPRERRRGQKIKKKKKKEMPNTNSCRMSWAPALGVFSLHHATRVLFVTKTLRNQFVKGDRTKCSALRQQ